jgi:hypothetical protein
MTDKDSPKNEDFSAEKVSDIVSEPSVKKLDIRLALIKGVRIDSPTFIESRILIDRSERMKPLMNKFF